MMQPLWKTVGQFLTRIKLGLLLGIYSKEEGRYFYPHVHSSIIDSSQNVEVTQVSTDG